MKDFKISIGSYGTMLVFLLLVWLTKSTTVFVIGWTLELLTCLFGFIAFEILGLALYAKIFMPGRFRMATKDFWAVGIGSVIVLALSLIPLALYHVVAGILMETPGI